MNHVLKRLKHCLIDSASLMCQEEQHASYGKLSSSHTTATPPGDRILLNVTREHSEQPFEEFIDQR